MLRKILFSLFIIFSLTNLSQAQRNVLEKLIKQNQNEFGPWVKDPAQFEVQIIYTQIDRDAQNRPQFTSHSYGLDPTRYFYPASTVKMPAAFVALEKLNELGIVGLDKYTPLKIGASREPQTAVVVDTATASNLPSVADYVRKIFLVSDNDAFNRLYEFLGQAYFNKQLREKGYRQSRIIHRLSISGFDSIGNRHTNPISFYDVDKLHYYQGPVYSKFYDDLGLLQQIRGKAYMDSKGEIIQEPFDFRYKNYVSIQDLHDMLRAVIFPQVTNGKTGFNLTEEDYQFLYQAMGQRPNESDWPRYDKEDSYVKFWIYGDQPGKPMPDHVRIFNKVGWAYGYLTDIAYIIDLKNDVEFMLSAVIHVNKNQTYNDGVYEYDEVGLPFFGQLGRVIYDYELNRKRDYIPDLSRFDIFK